MFTLPADKCTPSATESAAPSSTGGAQNSSTTQKPPLSSMEEEDPCPTEWPSDGNGTAVVPPSNAGSKNALGGAAIAGLIAAYFL